MDIFSTENFHDNENEQADDNLSRLLGHYVQEMMSTIKLLMTENKSDYKP